MFTPAASSSWASSRYTVRVVPGEVELRNSTTAYAAVDGLVAVWVTRVVKFEVDRAVPDPNTADPMITPAESYHSIPAFMLTVELVRMYPDTVYAVEGRTAVQVASTVVEVRPTNPRSVDDRFVPVAQAADRCPDRVNVLELEMVPWVRADQPSVERRSSVPFDWFAVSRFRSSGSRYR